MDSDNSYRPHRIDRDAYAQKAQALIAARDTSIRSHDVRNAKLTAGGLIVFASLSQVAVMASGAGYFNQGTVLISVALLQVIAGVGLLTRSRISWFLFNLVAAYTVVATLFVTPSLLSLGLVVLSVLDQVPMQGGLSLIGIVSQLFALAFVIYGLFTLNSEQARKLFR